MYFLRRFTDKFATRFSAKTLRIRNFDKAISGDVRDIKKTNIIMGDKINISEYM